MPNEIKIVKISKKLDALKKELVPIEKEYLTLKSKINDLNIEIIRAMSEDNNG